MAITAQSIIDKAELILQDTSNVRWSEDELLAWLNEAQRQIALVRPDASMTTGNVTLVEGTKQSLPSGALRLIDIVRNMGVGGATAGGPVRLVDRDVLDTQAPSWHTATASETILHYVYDPRNPRVFYVYPPATGTSPTVEAIYSVPPTEVAAIASNITLEDIYQGPILDWVLYRAFSKDAEHVANQELAARHLSVFNSALGVKSSADGASSPNANTRPTGGTV